MITFYILGPVMVKENVLRRNLSVYGCMRFEDGDIYLKILTISNVIFHSLTSARRL